MGRRVFLLILLAALVSACGTTGLQAGGEAAAKQPRMGPLRVLAANPRYFADGAGRPVYLTGSHVWWNLLGGRTWRAACLPIRPKQFDYGAYLRRLVGYRHNFFRLWTLELTRWQECDGQNVTVAPQPWRRTGPGVALDGRPRFDLTRLDPAYFARLRQRVARARRHKLYVSVMLFEGWGIQFAPAPWRWRSHPFHAANNVNGINGDLNRDGFGTEVHTLADRRILAVQERYVRRVVDAVSGLDNVLFEIANESGAYSTPWQYHMIRVIRRHEARKPMRHPIGMTYQNAHGTNETLHASPATWISPAGGPPFLDNPPVADGRRVSLSDTDHHCGICGDHHFPWKALTRGHNPIFMDPMDGDSNREAIRRAMGHSRHYAQRMNLASSRPLPGLCSTGFCLATPGRVYLVYQPAGGALWLDLGPARRSFRVEWFDPATGKRSFGRVSGGGRRALTPPFSGPAVLYVRR